MENKKSFGNFVQQKRKEAGLTQKELADRLYLTESAVSKWERGLSYPDITLIKDICEILQVSDHELLTASEDIQTRTNEKLAAKYMKLLLRLKLVQIIIYGIAIVTCFICNLAIQHTLSWFFIVLASLMTAASLTLLPVFLTKYRGAVSLAAFTGSLLLLLLVCCIYTGGDWFILTAVSVLFGLCLLFLPFVIRSAVLPQKLINQKALICMTLDTILLLLVLLVSNWYTGGGWFISTALPLAAFWLPIPWGLLILIRYARINGFLKTAACLGLCGLLIYLSDMFSSMLFDDNPALIYSGFDFANWNVHTINGNINVLLVLILLGLIIAFTVAGIVTAMRNSKKETNTTQNDI